LLEEPPAVESLDDAAPDDPGLDAAAPAGSSFFAPSSFLPLSDAPVFSPGLASVDAFGLLRTTLSDGLSFLGVLSVLLDVSAPGLPSSSALACFGVESLAAAGASVSGFACFGPVESSVPASDSAVAGFSTGLVTGSSAAGVVTGSVTVVSV